MFGINVRRQIPCSAALSVIYNATTATFATAANHKVHNKVCLFYFSILIIIYNILLFTGFTTIMWHHSRQERRQQLEVEHRRDEWGARIFQSLGIFTFFCAN
jgi:hypothetical protein